MKRPPALWQNPLSWLGVLVALAATAFGLPMMFIDMFSRHTDPYLAVIIYLVLPGAATGGVAVALLGMWLERRRRARHPTGELRLLPLINLNRPQHQAILLAGSLGFITLLALLSVTAYRAYHFTESVKFCGLVCHQVMKPEYVAYQHSPHARVACVECHVGSGADWYVRSKFNGLHQVYTAATKTYPKPIPTPVKNLRPAMDTCEQCHWPERFFGAQQKLFAHRLSDETNSPWQIRMVMQVGGGDPQDGASAGIHWHMNIAKEIEYIAGDERRETIPWVRVRERDGRETVYESADVPLTAEQVARSEVRRMDCVDCHNRPAHVYHPPDAAVDAAMDAGQMDVRLPYLKREAVRLLAAEYHTEGEALGAIRSGLAAFYKEQYPELAQTQPEAVTQAAEAAARLYARNMFPEMKADWRAHPNHLGHMDSAGCFRCHDGQHRSAAGQVITSDCNACHTILAQGPPAQLAEASLKAQSFQHPVDLGMDVTEMQCSQCHTGGGS